MLENLEQIYFDDNKQILVLKTSDLILKEKSITWKMTPDFFKCRPTCVLYCVLFLTKAIIF